MNVSGSSSTAGVFATRAVVKRPLNFFWLSDSPALRASSSTTMKPMLCRWAAYPGPGFPKPTTSERPTDP